MAAMNHLNLAQPQQPVDIDPNEVLREYGLDSIGQTSTVVQHENNIINIPNQMLEPPSISTTSASVEQSNITDVTSPSFNSELDAILAEAPNLRADVTDIAPEEDSEEFNEEMQDLDELFEEAENGLTQAISTASVSVDLAADSEPQHTEASNSPIRISTDEAIDLLPTNSEVFKIDDSTSRFSGAAWYHAIQDSKVLLAGLGGIGSYVLFCLSRMKPAQIFLYDDDVVETVNLSGQLYSSAMVGRTKVDAMALLAREFSMYYGIVAVPQRFTETTPAGDIMICGFDNMEARKIFFNAWINHLVNHPHPERCLFIDGRLNMEEFQVFCMKGDDTYNIKRYNTECMFHDYQAESEQCSMKQTTYCSNMIGSIIVNLFTNFIANTLNPVIERDLPFKTYYDAGMMYFKTET